MGQEGDSRVSFRFCRRFQESDGLLVLILLVVLLVVVLLVLLVLRC